MLAGTPNFVTAFVLFAPRAYRRWVSSLSASATRLTEQTDNMAASRLVAQPFGYSEGSHLSESGPFRHHGARTDAPKVLDRKVGSEKCRLPWANFAIMGLRRALLFSKPGFLGKYHAQGVKCEPSAILGGGGGPTPSWLRAWQGRLGYSPGTCMHGWGACCKNDKKRTSLLSSSLG